MIVIDTETTGLGPEDQVVELAAMWGARPEEHAHFLVRPTVPVAPEARAAHHITDGQLARASSAPVWRPTLEALLREHPGPLVAHNAEFDVRMIGQTWPGLELPPVVCTYRCALRLWPDAPSHSNQTLRYWLDLDPGPMPAGLPPHRALPDALVTYALARRMIEQLCAEPADVDGDADTWALGRLLAITAEPVLLHRVRFGKHSGQLWADVPRDYLRWLLDRGGFDADVVHTARHYLGRTT